MKAKILLATIALLSSASAQDLLQHSLDLEDGTDDPIELVAETAKAKAETAAETAAAKTHAADLAKCKSNHKDWTPA